MEYLTEAFAAYQRVRGLSARTIDRRTWSLGQWAEHLERAGRDHRDAGPTDVEVFLSRWPSAQSRYSVRSDLRQFYRWALMRDQLTHDPTAKTDAPRIPRRAVTPVEPVDVHRLIAASSGDVRRMIMLAAYGGLRVSEIAALEGDDIRTGDRALVVRNGKGGKGRVIPLAPQLVDELAGVGPGRLFPGIDGQGVSWRIRQQLRALGIRRRPHDLRAACATALVRRAGGNVVVVAQFLGHESLLTTQRYMRWHPENEHLVADLFAA